MRKIAWQGTILGGLIVLSLSLPQSPDMACATTFTEIWQRQIAVASPDSETIRPTNHYDAAMATTNPTQAYDGNTATSGDTKFGAAATNDPSINYGQDDANADTWQTKSQSWDSAILYATIERAGANDDRAGVSIINSLDTEKHTLLALGSSEFSKQEVSQTLSSADWGGSGFPDISDLRVKVESTKSTGPDDAYLKIYDIRIVGSYIPPIISITLTDAAPDGIHFGNLNPGTPGNPDGDQSEATPSIIVNVGSETTVNVDLQIKGTDFSGTFTVDNAKYSLMYDGAKNALSTTHATFATDVAPGGHQDLWHWLDVPNGTTAGYYESIFSYKAVEHIGG